MNKKYRMKREGALYRIYAVRSFSDVEVGQKGGLIEKENNLAHDGDCWVYENTCVYGNAFVYDNAQVSGDARVFGDAQVAGNARVCGYARVFDNARVGCNAQICNYMCVNFYINNSKILQFRYQKQEAYYYFSADILQIGCESHSLDHWLEHYAEIGRRYEYSEKQINEYQRFMIFCQEMKQYE